MAVEQKEMVGTLKQKVNKVIALYTNVKQENNKLLQQQKELKETLKIKETELEFYKNKYNKIKLAKSIVASAGESHDAKIKINRIVREIDKCIALLNR
jgi:predicted Zn-dependent protease